MWQRFTERARRVVFYAQEEAARLGENYVGTEHLTLGLVRENDSVAARILGRLGVSLSRIRADIEKQVTRGEGNLGQDMQLTPRAKRVIDLAYEEARQLNNNYIGTEHLLLGLIREGDGLGARVLIQQGADLERTRHEVFAMQEGESARLRAAGQDDMPCDPLGSLRDMASSLASLANTPERLSSPPRFARDALLAAQEACKELDDLVSIADLTGDQARALIDFAYILKQTAAINPGAHVHLLPGRTIALIFEKPSLRT